MAGHGQQSAVRDTRAEPPEMMALDAMTFKLYKLCMEKLVWVCAT